MRAMGIRDKPIAPASPWQNGFAERLIGSIGASVWIISLSWASASAAAGWPCCLRLTLFAAL
jgi:hypothetical protein